MDDVQPGQTIGPYRILNQVGQGGMATVYRAYHAAMDRYVALKLLPQKLAGSAEFTGRFRQEARTIARLEHPHILPVYDYGEAGGFTYLVMRYLEAGTLKDRLLAGELPLREVDRIFTQLADALDYAHAQGVVHRDLKPSNVLLDSRGGVFLTDFGIAKLLEGGAHFTTTGAMIGTPAYMSPEQAQGLPVDRRSDLYSLGIILFEMVTGRVPFEADTPLAVILKHVSAPLPLPSSVKPGLAPSIEKVLLKVLAKDPNERHASTGELLDGWRAALRDVGAATSTEVVAPPPQPAEAPRPAPTAAARLAPPPPAPAAAPDRPAPAPAVPPAPPSNRRPLARPLALAGLAGALLCAGLVCALFAANRLLQPGAPTAAAGGPVTQAVDRPTEAANLPLGTLLAPGEGTAAPPATTAPRPVLGGTWQSWTAANTVLSTVFRDNQLLTGGPGGLTGWDPSTGAVTQRLTLAEGLPGVYVTALQSDEAGGFFIGTDNGLVEFTGDQMLIHNLSTGLDSNYISAIASTTRGLVVGTFYSDRESGGLQVRTGYNEWAPLGEFPSANPGEQAGRLSNAVMALLEDTATGELWVGTTHGLGRYDGTAWTRYTVEDGLPGDGIFALALSGGQLLAGTDVGLAVFNGQGFDRVEASSLSPVYGLISASDGSLWVAGGGGVARRGADGDWTTWDYLQLPAYNTYGGVEGAGGVVYFGTDFGVLSFNGDDFAAWSVPNVPANAAFGRIVHEASADQLWFIQEYGARIDVFEPAKDVWFPGSDYDCDACAPVGWDDAGRLWAAGDRGVWVFEGNALVEAFDSQTGLPADEVRALDFGPDGTAWIATTAGLAHYNNGAIDQVYDTTNSGLSFDAVYSVLEASDGSVWAASEQNLNRRLPDGTWVTYQTGSPFQHDVRVSDLAEDGAGNVWVATLGDGLYRYRAADDAWDAYSPLVPGVALGTFDFNCVTVAPDGQVWAGGYFAGAARFDGAEWLPFGPEDGLIHSNVNDIFVDTDGTAWFATSGGVSRWEP